MYLFGNGHQHCKSPLGNGRHVYVTKDHVIDFGIVSSCICTLHGGSGGLKSPLVYIVYSFQPTMATYQISPPEKFNFHQPDDWSKWIRRFERFRQASGLASKSEESQVNSLVYCMGNEADDILSSFGLTNEDSKKYTTVKERFEGHFIKKRSVIFERAKFNQRVQKEGEAVDTFVTALYQLAEHCRYGDLRDEMIRDRIVVGLRDTNLSVKLQMEETLTLEKAVAMSRQSESVKKQQTVVRACGICG